MNKFIATSMLVMSTMIATKSNAQFSSFATPTNGGVSFWDNRSSDGKMCNIGYVLNGTAGRVSQEGTSCNNQRPSPWLPYAGVTPTTQKDTPGFTGLFTETATVTVFGDIAGANQDWGWFVVNTDGTHTRTSLSNVLLNNPSTIGSNTTAWGLFINLVDGSTALSTGSQFAVFGAGLNTFLVGIEDVNVTGGDRDYNDVVLRLEGNLNVVPEPSTYALMATGLLGLGIFTRKKLS
jgi:hypothetical protein